MAYVNNGVSEFDADAMKDFYNFPHTCNWPDHTWITVYNQKEKDFVYDRMKETKTAAEVDIRLYRSSTVAKEVLNSMLTAAPAHQGSAVSSGISQAPGYKR